MARLSGFRFPNSRKIDAKILSDRSGKWPRKLACECVEIDERRWMTEDQLRDLEGDIQKLTDRFVKSIDDHIERKEAEVMKV